ncbi:hypothetical protein NC99_02450 [Sunxiuqinia dokdonensis]|uniref:Uncharacterized protein n=1 Tax=Sunxiuqinia dokdonensis TaxID=1409788 RepID=A0A0L8VEE2_9BACT|nr:hypothetical protein NC99_02450 [Sunxiuqinia dokdonensis]
MKSQQVRYFFEIANYKITCYQRLKINKKYRQLALRSGQEKNIWFYFYFALLCTKFTP